MVKLTVDLLIEDGNIKPFGEGLFTLTWFSEHLNEFEIVEFVEDCSRNKNDIKTILKLRRKDNA